MASSLDGQIELACGAFSSSPEKSRQAGAELYLPPDRVYDSYDAMIAAEARRPAADRMDFVAIVTPNYTHADIARKALRGKS